MSASEESSGWQGFRTSIDIWLDVEANRSDRERARRDRSPIVGMEDEDHEHLAATASLPETLVTPLIEEYLSEAFDHSNEEVDVPTDTSISPIELAIRPELRETLDVRVARGRLVKIGKSYESVVAGLGLYVSAMTTTGMLPLVITYTGLGSAAIVRAFMNSYVRLSEQELIDVFETVFELQGGLARRHWIRRQKNMVISPTEDQVCAALIGKMPPDDVREYLRRLCDMEILRQDDGRWSVRFL